MKVWNCGLSIIEGFQLVLFHSRFSIVAFRFTVLNFIDGNTVVTYLPGFPLCRKLCVCCNLMSFRNQMIEPWLGDNYVDGELVVAQLSIGESLYVWGHSMKRKNCSPYVIV